MNKQIELLASEIFKHKKFYYGGERKISDEEYDLLEEKLKKLAPDHPVLSFVGSEVVNSNLKVEHAVKMLSLDKTYSKDDLISWIGDREVISLFKIDGSSCSLVYKDGKLDVAKTRGDGSFGENITSSVLHIESIPFLTPSNKDFEVRGEIYCTEENFIKLSDEMASLGLDRPSSQRNIVAGLLGRKENRALARYLSFQAFDYISDERIALESQKLDHLSTLGFMVPQYNLHKNSSSLKNRIDETKTFMSEGDYLIDGLVVILNKTALHRELGETGHHPRYKLAFKFQGETKPAVINSIDWQVSRNGTLTPVANIEPIELSGAIISRVTLHNYGQVKTHDLAQGDVIEVVRSGEVIPKFLGVVKKSSNSFSSPIHCPSCSSDLVVNTIRLVCVNEQCRVKIKEQILNFISQAKIDDLSDKRIEEMMTKGLIKTIPDLYRVTKEDLLKLDKVKEKMAQKLFTNIQSSKELKLIQFISAIGVEGVSSGSKIEKLIHAGFDDLDKITNVKHAELVTIDGFADKSATSFIESLGSKKELISELISLGVTVKSGSLVKASNVLEGVLICITGELSAPRKQIELSIKENGGKVTGSVTKKTTYLLTNETDSSSSKFTKAQELGIKIISEEDLIGIIRP